MSDTKIHPADIPWFSPSAPLLIDQDPSCIQSASSFATDLTEDHLAFKTISRQLMSLEKPKKPKMLVVDDEPDNLDLLYRTFRRDFNVLRAESGMAALEVLAAEGEVAVIISDQRMPEMKGTEFLSKTVPQFPDTMRIILTGFTDVEDLVEAINSGQVYKYITKPWDPTELKQVVQRAAETYELLKQRTEELYRAQAQMALLNQITQSAQHAAKLEDILLPIVRAYAQTFAVENCGLYLLEDRSIVHQVNLGQPLDMSQTALLQTTVDTGKMQVVPPLAASNAQLQSAALLPSLGAPTHLLVPMLFHKQVLAILSLQWQQPQSLREDELALIHFSAQQIGIVIACLRAQTVAA
ncbi:MAG: response regulator [Elainella sp. Prado103]|nr:response regulator [Elainella sp. Prado103]